MRSVGILLAAVLIGAGAQAGGRATVPGFSIEAPNAPWVLRDNGGEQTKDGSVLDQYNRGRFVLHYTAQPAGAGALSSVYIQASGQIYPNAPSDGNAMLARLKADSEREARTGSARNSFIASDITETVQDGVACLRWRYTTEDRGVPGHGGEVFVMKTDDLMCPHPDFPSYVVELIFSTRQGPGDPPLAVDADGEAVRQSLKFTHFGYRMRAIPVGVLPQGLADADGSVWVAYGNAQGKVARINPKTNAVVAIITVGRLPIGMVADDAGVWVANYQDNTVSRIDPQDNLVVATIKTPDGPASIASGAGSVWVVATKDCAVARIDPASGKVTEISLGWSCQAAGIAFTNGALYVTEFQSGKIFRIDPATNKVTGSITGPRFSKSLLADGRYLWAAAQEPRMSGPCLLCSEEDRSPSLRVKKTAVWRIDTQAPDAAPRIFERGIGNMPNAMALWNGRVWVTNWTGATLSMFDPAAASAEAAYLPIGVEPVYVLAAHGSLWVSVSGIPKGVIRVDPQ